MIIFNKEAMEYRVMGNNLNPIELIALGSEHIQTMVWKPAKKPLEKAKRVWTHMPFFAPKTCSK